MFMGLITNTWNKGSNKFYKEIKILIYLDIHLINHITEKNEIGPVVFKELFTG